MVILYQLLFIFFSINRTPWAEINGITYKLGGVIILDMDYVNPKFGLIKDIFILNSEIFFVSEILWTVSFVHHFHSFLVYHADDPIDFCICKQQDFYDHTMLSPYPCSDEHSSYYVPLKYQLIDNI